MKLQKILTIGTIGAATIIGSYTALAQNDSELNNYSGYGS